LRFVSAAIPTPAESGGMGVFAPRSGKNITVVLVLVSTTAITKSNIKMGKNRFIGISWNASGRSTSDDNFQSTQDLPQDEIVAGEVIVLKNGQGLKTCAKGRRLRGPVYLALMRSACHLERGN
jgi:hypothetical protein